MYTSIISKTQNKRVKNTFKMHKQTYTRDTHSPFDPFDAIAYILMDFANMQRHKMAK